jgi:histidinol-phosphate aminotransferase
MTRTAESDLAHHGDRDAVAGLIDLAVNVRADAPPRWLTERLAQVDLSRYPDESEAVRAVAARHHRPASEVLLTAGAAEAFVLLARALHPVHAVVIHPQFTEPEAALRAAGHTVDRIVLDEPFQLDPRLVPETADLVMIGNPTNPTSVLHPATAITALLRPGRLVVVDEAFADCVPGETASLAARADLDGLVIIRSLTKTWGLAGLRAGYLLATAAVIDELKRVQPLWPVSSPALDAAVACSDPAAVAEAAEWATGMARERDRLVTLLDAIAQVRVAAAPAASFVLVWTPRPDTRVLLHDRGFAVRRGESFPGLDAHWIRVAVRDEPTSIALAHALQEVLR